MNDPLAEALRLREAKEHEASRDLLVELVAAKPDDAVLNYQAAWAHDLLGLEREAVPYYRRALDLGLEGEDLEGALLGLGSTYRALGEYELAVETLRRGVAAFPEHGAMGVFLAMSLYNTGRHAEAMTLLLQALAATSSDASIQAYQRAIAFYADKLDETW